MKRNFQSADERAKIPKWSRWRNEKFSLLREQMDWYRFWSKVEKSPNGCWLWVARAVHDFGYGVFSYQGKGIEAHTYAYRKCVGDIPSGKQIDHLCRVPACVNPAHLEAVTLAENVLRGESIFAKEARQTHCKRGHLFTSESLHIRRDGRKSRICVTCCALRDKLRWERKSHETEN